MPRENGNSFSPYACFFQVCQDEHKKTYPSEIIQIAELSKKCSEKWKTMSDRDKQRFVDMAAEKSKAGGDSGAKKRKRGGAEKKDKDPFAPKRSLGSFFIFSQEKRPEVKNKNPEWRIGEVAKELGRMWKEMTEEEKQPYIEKAAEGKARYEEELADYNSAGGDRGGKKNRGGASTSAKAANADSDDDDD